MSAPTTPRGNPSPAARTASERVSVGRAGEELIAQLLDRSGWTVRDRNWRPARGRNAPRGELDIVAERQGRVTVFEVKTRSGSDHGHPFEAVGPEKLRRLHLLAGAWAREHHEDRVPGVDVVAVHWPRGRSPRVEHVGSLGWP
ncbi:YraN family protein [Kocuria sp.]|uniref:YraN family protein n=1 Tax=Kocuria sp. TaxID=1871328 RepID=UPI0026DD667F|nr:YraN family protein [Kocuria sp.]MDO4918489.1 YraN family protein [Kocuria sp.]